MSAVGGFPGISNLKSTIRAPQNPLDKSTVVSILPRMIKEVKHTISPGKFVVEAGTYEKPSVLVVGASSWWREIDEESPLLEIPNWSTQVADAIVKDYCNGLLACNMVDTKPGLFFIPGAVAAEDVKKHHSFDLIKAKANQDRWFLALVKMADTLWARTGGNPLCIADDMRMAAEHMGFKGKDWMKDITLLEQIKCVACGFPRNADYPVCPNCKAVIDINKATELGIVFAKL